MRDSLNADLQAALDGLGRDVSRSGVVARRRRADLPGDRRRARDSDRHGDVAAVARTEAVVRGADETGMRLEDLRLETEMNCREVEDKLAAYVDGRSPTQPRDRARISRRATPAASSRTRRRVARTVLQGARRAAVADRAAGTAHAHRREHPRRPCPKPPAPGLPILAWTGRLTAFAAAAMVVLTLGAVLLPVATIRSTALLAAQLALDHLKCFTIEGDADGAADREGPRPKPRSSRSSI